MNVSIPSGPKSSRLAKISIAAGMGLWAIMVVGLTVIPLDRGSVSDGVYALTGTITQYITSDGERVVKPLPLRR
tara:strand:+ start:451 stop:672 length:222 start_codon:yes stop_codon:yes gene_type:complete